MAGPDVPPEPASAESDTAGTHRPARVATFNLHHGAPPDRWFRPSVLRRAVGRLGVELLALQEVDRRNIRTRWCDQAALVAGATGLRPVFARARRIAGGDYGIALLTRSEPTAVEVVALPRFGGEQRVALLASVELAGRPVSVCVTHLQNAERVAAAQLEVVLDRLVTRPGPLLLLGDMNAPPRIVGPLVEAAGMELAHLPATFPRWAPRLRIDHIASSGLDVEAAELPDVWTSDHAPAAAIVRHR